MYSPHRLNLLKLLSKLDIKSAHGAYRVMSILRMAGLDVDKNENDELILKCYQR